MADTTISIDFTSDVYESFFGPAINAELELPKPVAHTERGWRMFTFADVDFETARRVHMHVVEETRFGEDLFPIVERKALAQARGILERIEQIEDQNKEEWNGD